MKIYLFLLFLIFIGCSKEKQGQIIDPVGKYCGCETDEFGNADYNKTYTIEHEIGDTFSVSYSNLEFLFHLENESIKLHYKEDIFYWSPLDTLIPFVSYYNGLGIIFSNGDIELDIQNNVDYGTNYDFEKLNYSQNHYHYLQQLNKINLQGTFTNGFDTVKIEDDGSSEFMDISIKKTIYENSDILFRNIKLENQLCFLSGEYIVNDSIWIIGKVQYLKDSIGMNLYKAIKDEPIYEVYSFKGARIY